jgi:putative endonuclease
MARSRRAWPERSRRNPEDAYLAYAVRSFSTTEADTGRTGHGPSLGREQELLASCHVRQLHTGTLYIGVTSNLYLRVMQHKEGTWKGFTAACGCKRVLYFEGYEDIRKAIAREKQLKGWRDEKKLNLIRTINPEFKDLAQTWGWKMITAHEKMYP